MSEHDHAGHDHNHVANANQRALAMALGITVVFMVVEAVGGWYAGSLALIADAGHMLTDAAALIIALMGLRFALRPADPARSYGYARFEVLSGLINAILLLVLVVWIVIEAILRLRQPEEVLPIPMLVIGVLGLLANLASFRILQGGDKDQINMRGAILHVLSDLLGSIGAIFAALVIWFTGWMPIDPILSILVSLLIVRSGWALLRHSLHILLEGTPKGMSGAEIDASIRGAVPGIADVHHVHAWSLSSGKTLATLHLRLDDTVPPHVVMCAVKDHLRDRFGIAHSTVQIDLEGCPDESHDDEPAVGGAAHDHHGHGHDHAHAHGDAHERPA